MGRDRLGASMFAVTRQQNRKKTYISFSAAVDLFKIIPREADNPYVICGKKDKSHLINLQKPWMRIRKRADLEDVRLHDLRHTFASIAASNGLSLPSPLSHRQTQTTARYAHLIGQPLLEASEKISVHIMGSNKIPQSLTRKKDKKEPDS